MDAETLAQVLRPVGKLFRPGDFPDLLVGLQTPDDAAVWKLDSKHALVVTTDFFTPVVDDPYDYGSIAAANSLSDVYAMGGQPFLALNIAALQSSFPVEINSEILRGGAEKVREAGVVLAGGHTIKDDEPKYGLVVIGFVHPKKMITKAGVKPGDFLVLTKPLGMGVTTTAIKDQKADPRDVAEAVEWMKRLNRVAASIAVETGVRGGTDVTGFGLLGHALEMTQASNLGMVFYSDKIPYLSGAQKYASSGTFPGGAWDNLHNYESKVKWEIATPDETKMLLYDPQTSGGLILAVAEQRLPLFLTRCKESDQPVWVIGQAVKGRGVKISHSSRK
jgi:selenide, water dikinase